MVEAPYECTFQSVGWILHEVNVFGLEVQAHLSKRSVQTGIRRAHLKGRQKTCESLKTKLLVLPKNKLLHVERSEGEGSVKLSVQFSVEWIR